MTFTTREGFTVALPTRDQVRPLVMVLAAVAAFLLASFVSTQWMTLLNWWHQVPFGANDPVLGYDAGFYVFTLPALELLRGFLLGLIVLAVIGVGGAVLRRRPGGADALRPARRESRAHASHVAGGGVLPGAGAGRMAQPRPGNRDAVGHHPGRQLRRRARADAGRARTDSGGTGRRRPRGIAAALTGRVRLLIVGRRPLRVTMFAGQGYAATLQRFAVTPNEQQRETPFMEYNIAATRAAFALDQVEERELPGEATLSRAEHREPIASTLENVRLWDHQPLLETFGQLQEIRPYYDFVSVDNDRYTINGQSRQVMLSVREMNPAALSNRTWINERLVFTHGHGLTLGPVNEVTSDGLPVLFVRDLPPVTTVDIDISAAEHLLRRARQRLRDRADHGAGVRLSEGRRQRLLAVRGHGRHPDRLALEQAAVRDSLPLLPNPAERRHHQREPVDVRPPDSPPRGEDRAVPGARRGSVSGGQRGPHFLDPGRLHGERSVSVRVSRGRRQLHPQLGEDHHRRLSRHRHVLRRRHHGSDRADASRRFSRT